MHSILNSIGDQSCNDASINAVESKELYITIHNSLESIQSNSIINCPTGFESMCIITITHSFRANNITINANHTNSIELYGTGTDIFKGMTLNLKNINSLFMNCNNTNKCAFMVINIFIPRMINNNNPYPYNILNIICGDSLTSCESLELNIYSDDIFSCIFKWNNIINRWECNGYPISHDSTTTSPSTTINAIVTHPILYLFGIPLKLIITIMGVAIGFLLCLLFSIILVYFWYIKSKERKHEHHRPGEPSDDIRNIRNKGKHKMPNLRDIKSSHETSIMTDGESDFRVTELTPQTKAKLFISKQLMRYHYSRNNSNSPNILPNQPKLSSLPESESKLCTQTSITCGYIVEDSATTSNGNVV